MTLKTASEAFLNTEHFFLNTSSTDKITGWPERIPNLNNECFNLLLPLTPPAINRKQSKRCSQDSRKKNAIKC